MVVVYSADEAGSMEWPSGPQVVESRGATSRHVSCSPVYRRDVGVQVAVVDRLPFVYVYSDSEGAADAT